MHERREAYAFLYGGCLVAASEFALLLVVSALLQGTVEKLRQINPLPDYLARRRRRSFLQKISSPKVLWTEAYCFCHSIEMPLKSKDALGRPKSAKGSMGRGVGGHSTAANADIRAKVRSGGVNSASGEHHRGKSGIR